MNSIKNMGLSGNKAKINKYKSTGNSLKQEFVLLHCFFVSFNNSAST